jgi:MraZ protein
VFTGEYRHTVDDKGRIAVPVKFRAQLDPGSMISGWFDDCLAIHTKTGWEDLSTKIAALPLTDDRARLFARFVFSHATEAEMDKQGRVLLPAFLRQSVGLVGEAVLVGSRDHAEIWAPDRWDTYRKALDDPRELASAFKGLGI